MAIQLSKYPSSRRVRVSASRSESAYQYIRRAAIQYIWLAASRDADLWAQMNPDSESNRTPPEGRGGPGGGGVGRTPT